MIYVRKIQRIKTATAKLPGYWQHGSGMGRSTESDYVVGQSSRALLSVEGFLEVELVVDIFLRGDESRLGQLLVIA